MTSLSAKCSWTDRGRVSPSRANVDKGSYGEFLPSMNCKVTCAEVHRPSSFSLARSIMDHNTVVYGVDVSKAKLVVAQDDVQTLAEVDNRPESIAAWLAGLPKGAVVAMEATGIYHRLLAHLAHAAGMRVYVLNPQTLKHYAWAI